MHANTNDRPQNCLEDSEMLDQPEEGGGSGKSLSKDCDEPKQKQTRKNSRQFSSSAEQCAKIEAMFRTELHKYPYIRAHLDNLASQTQEQLLEIAREHTYDKLSPVEAFFFKWLVEEALPNRELNFSEFARRIFAKRHQVARTILPRVIRTYVKHVDRAVFYFLLVTKMPE